MKDFTFSAIFNIVLFGTKFAEYYITVKIFDLLICLIDIITGLFYFY